MSELNLKLKTYDQLTFEVSRLNIDKYLLEQKLEQKENIIKEVREYIENHSITNMEWWITGEQKIECKFMKNANPQELLEILERGNE